VFYSTNSGNLWIDYNSGLETTGVLSITHDSLYYYLCTTPPGTIWRSSTTLAVEDPANKINQLLLYPNPASNRLNISVPGLLTRNITVRIFDITGSQVFKSGFDGPSVQIDLGY